MSPIAKENAKLLLLIESELERFGNRYLPSLRFEESVEEMFRSQDASRRTAFQFRMGLIMLLSFNAFLIGDWFIIREHFVTAVAVRLGLVTLLSLPLLWAIHRNKSRWRRELSVCGIGCLACLGTLYLAFHDGRTLSLQAEPTVLIILVVLTSLIRAEFFFCVAAATVCLVANTVYVASVTDVPMLDRALSALPMIAATLLMLLANFLSWRQLRTSFLLQQRGKLQAELLKERNHELRLISERDELTGMGSRYAYERECRRLFDEAVKEKKPISVVMVDVDLFKAVNDEYGHAYGDRVLMRVASLIQQALRAEADFAARYGGEEFIVLLPDTDGAAAVKVAERIRTLVQVAGSPALTRDAAVPQRFTTVSCGVATMVPDFPTEPKAIVELADRALYRAKAQGRNRVCTADAFVIA